MFLLLFFLLGIGKASAKSTLTGPARSSCSANYNTPCARVNSEWLAVSTAQRIESFPDDDLLAKNQAMNQLFDNITAGLYNRNEGFYPFVYDRQTTVCVAHGAAASYVGLTVATIFDELTIGFTSTSALFERVEAAAENGGDWVRYIWNNGGIGNKIAYTTALTDRYFIGVGFTDQRLPPSLPCSAKTDSWCSFNNAQSLVGFAQSRLEDATTLATFERLLYDISFDTNTYQIEGGYYLFMYRYDGKLVAHAKLQDFVGQSMPDIFVRLNLAYEEGVVLNQRFVSAASGENEGWIQYPWKNNATESEYEKIAHVVEIEFLGVQYYLGAGYDFVMGDILPGPLNTTCPTYNLPCAYGTTMQLTSHAMAHAVSSPLSTNEIFDAVTFDPSLKLGFYYVFFFDFNGTCVSHGRTPDYVGMTLYEVMENAGIVTDGHVLHDQWRSVATNGGGYVAYDWNIPNVPDSGFVKITYIFPLTLNGKRYYGGCGFNRQRAPLQLELGYGTTKKGDPIPCSRNYNSDCSEINSQAILGQALGDLVLTSTETKARPGSSVGTVEGVLASITARDDLYRANDFFVAVFAFDEAYCGAAPNDNSGCCVAHGGDASLVGKTWQQIFDMNRTTSVRGEDIHGQLAQKTDKGGVLMEYTLVDRAGSVKPIKAFSSPFRDNGDSFYVVTEFINELPPPTCDACPDGNVCMEPDQSFCSIVPEKRPFVRSGLFVAIVIIVAMLPAFGLLFCWISRRREKTQSEAQIRKIDEQMEKLRNQVEREQMTTAQTRKLVSSLFPENVQDQILEQLAEEETATDKLTSFLTDEKQSDSSPSRLKGKARDIAEFFPSATIIFADIAGFTAWSSTREPTQVFRLLEGVYQYFDKLAKQRDVFKVETIGDCYVAVAGLPKKMEDHAITMSLFARDCLEAFNRLVKEMEVELGPDTGDLRLRTGLHSGSVTAGVLKSDKARFQLFGDAVNTASRLESTGVPGKIQISQSTADLIKAAGKSDWFTARAERIFAKGKGEIETYFLSLNAIPVDSDESLQAQGGRGSEGYIEYDAGRSARLVQWVTDELRRLLKQICGQNQGNSKRMNFSPVSALEGKTVLEEVREIIHMPSYNAQEAIDADDIELDKKVDHQLELYVSTISSMYRENAFHNFEHAAHVTMSVLKLMSRIVAPDLRNKMQKNGSAAWRKHDHTYGITSDPLTQFACAFSALIHDIEHPGVPNSTLVVENPILAQKYKGCSVAEQNSVDLAWKVLMTDDYKDLCFAICGGDSGNMTRFRQLVVNGVMSTDIMDPELKKLRDMRWDKAFIDASDSNPKDASDRKATIVIENIIQASDVAHTMQHWQVYRKWNERLFEEILAAYLAGRSPNDPAEYWYKGELGFFDFYIIPLAKKLEDCGVFGVSSLEYLGYAEQNRQEWELRGKALVEKMSREIRAQMMAKPKVSFVSI